MPPAPAGAPGPSGSPSLPFAADRTEPRAEVWLGPHGDQQHSWGRSPESRPPQTHPPPIADGAENHAREIETAWGFGSCA